MDHCTLCEAHLSLCPLGLHLSLCSTCHCAPIHSWDSIPHSRDLLLSNLRDPALVSTSAWLLIRLVVFETTLQTWSGQSLILNCYLVSCGVKIILCDSTALDCELELSTCVLWGVTLLFPHPLLGSRRHMSALVAKPDKLSCFLFPYHHSLVICFIHPLKFAGLCRLVPHYHRSLMIPQSNFRLVVLFFI
jgi:hypothetical protein